MNRNSEFEWRSPPIQATIATELIRVTWLINASFDLITSRLLLRRNFESEAEPATLLYPSVTPQVLHKPTPQSFIDAGLFQYKIEVKRFIKYRRYIYTEPVYSVKIEVQ